MAYLLESMQQYSIWRWLNRQGIAPVELESAGPNALRATMADGSVTLYVIDGDGVVTSQEVDPAC